MTCPTVRVNPAIVAQAAATSAVMLRGRFTLGLRCGEALNEHLFGAPWPTAQRRLDMLEEAVGVIRELFTGDVVRHEGRHFTIDAARLGDGYITTSPDTELLQRFRDGSGGKPAQIGSKACWAPGRDEGVETAHRLWANSGLPGELARFCRPPSTSSRRPSSSPSR